MSGSVGGGGDLLSLFAKLFGGGTSTAGMGDVTGAATALASGAPTSSEQVAYALNPLLTGTPTTSQSLAASSPASLGGTVGAGGSGPSSKDLVSALQGAGKGVSGMQEQQMRPNVNVPMTSSQAVPGRGQDMGTLLQLLQQRNQYGMGSGSTSGGLLGVR